jgi:uncharacterized protein (TIGR03435 family)
MTKTKTTVLVSVPVLALMAAVIAVKLLFFPSVNDKFFQVRNNGVLRQAPPGLVVVRPTHFPKPPTNGMAFANVKGVQWMVGRNVTFQNLIAMAYSYNPGRISLPVGVPKNNFDFLVTVPKDPEQHLQSAIRRKLGYVAEKETRGTPVLALKVEDPNSPGLKVSTAAREDISQKNGRLYFTHAQLRVVTDGLENFFKTPIVDKTGLTNFYDFSLVWDAQTARQIQSGTLDRETGRKILAEWGLGLEPDTASMEMLVVSKGLPAMAAPADKTRVLLGPLNPGAESGSENWFYGMSGTASLSVDSTEPATGAKDFMLGNTTVGRENHADWRSEIFPLGAAANGGKPVAFSFAYKLSDAVKDGDNLRVQFRFYDKATNYLDQKEFWVGSQSHDSAMTSYKTITTSGILAPPGAQMSDVAMSANFYDGDNWSSGTGRFDNIFVTTLRPFAWLKVVTWVMVLAGVAGLTALAIHFGRRSAGRNRMVTSG